MKLIKEIASIPVKEAFAKKTYRNTPTYRQGKSYTRGGNRMEEFKQWLMDVYGMVPKVGDSAIEKAGNEDDEAWMADVLSNIKRTHTPFANRTRQYQKVYDHNTYAVVGIGKDYGHPAVWVIQPGSENYYGLTKSVLKHWNVSFKGRVWSRSAVVKMVDNSNFSWRLKPVLEKSKP